MGIIKHIALVMLIILFFSCSYSDKVFGLSDIERRMINAFTPGDTIQYVNEAGRVHKIIVLRIDSVQQKHKGYLMAKPAFKEWLVFIKHIADDPAHIGFINNDPDMPDTLSQILLGMAKYPQDDVKSYFFHFKDFYSYNEELGNPNPDTLFINRIPVTDYYKITPSLQSDIGVLYFTVKNGLIAFTLKNGECWVRK